jgi:Na+/H+-dicarboxylate symporter
VATLGPQLFGFYAKPLGLYYIAGIVYFLVFFSLYAFMAKGQNGVKSFWTNAIYPTLTALSTCSSFCNHACQFTGRIKDGIPSQISNIVIPIGTTLHKNGSSMSSIIKIYVAFLIIGRDFFDPTIYFSFRNYCFCKYCCRWNSEWRIYWGNADDFCL